MAKFKQTRRKSTGGRAPQRTPVHDTTTRSHDTAAPSLPRSTAQHVLSSESNFNWDVVEVSIDAEILDLGTIWLPMVSIKPDPAVASVWYQFELEDLKKSFESETGVVLATEKYDLLYANEHSTLAFNRNGGFRIALKRFMEAGGAANNILSFQIQARKPKSTRGTESQRSKRARSPPTGAEGDFSDAALEQAEPQQKRPRTSVRATHDSDVVLSLIEEHSDRGSHDSDDYIPIAKPRRAVNPPRATHRQ